MSEQTDRLKRIKRMRDIKALREKSAQPSVIPQGPSALEAAGQGALQGATLGLGDEIGAAMETGMDWLAQKGLMPGVDRSPTEVARELQAQGIKGDIGPTTAGEFYRQSREEGREDIAQAQEAHPLAFGAAEFAGGMLVPGMGAAGAAKGAAGLAKAGRLAGVGAGSGALGAVGTSEADLTKGEIGEFAGDVATGAAFGAGTSILGSGIGATTRKIANSELMAKLGDKAKARAGKAAKNLMDPSATDRAKNKLTGELDALGEKIVDEQVSGPLTSRTKIMSRLMEKKQGVGDELGKLRERQVEGLDRNLVADKLLERANMAEAAGQDSLAGRFRKEAAAVYSKKSQNFLKRKDTIQKQIDLDELKLGRLDPEDKEYAKIQQRIAKKRDEIGQIEEAVLEDGKRSFDLQKLSDKKGTLQEKANYRTDKSSDQKEAAKAFREIEDEIAPELKPMKEGYGQLSEAIDNISKAEGKKESRSFWDNLQYGVPGVLGASAATAVGAPALVGAGAAIGSRMLWNRFGPQFTAAGFNKASKVLKNPKWGNALASAAERGGTALSTAHMTLMRRDPEYREAYNKEQAEQEEE